MHIIFRSFWLVMVVIVCTSCSSGGLRHGSQSQILASATEAFSRLKDAGKVPGFGPDEHGNLQSEAFQRGSAVKYPFSVAMYVSKQNDQSVYAYRLTKDRNSAAWRLTGAKRGLPDGKWEDLKIE